MLMTPSLSEGDLSRLSELLEQWMGLHFPKERWRDLRRGVESARDELGFPDTESCVRRLISAPVTDREVEILASHLTVGETYFLRDGNVFEALEARILPELIRGRRETSRRLRLWSAGCCTGEEPYSLAMLLDRVIPERETWNLTLLATDINPRFIRKAREGVYREWSFRDSPAWIPDAYFHKRRDGSYEVQPRIRRSVTFSHLNLAGDAYPSLATNTNAMDVILCRNVLMYFTAERAKRVAERLSRSLVEGALLIVSPTELSAARVPSLVPVEFPGMIALRKTSAVPQPTVKKNLAPDLTLAEEFELARRAHRSALAAAPRPEPRSKAGPRTGPGARPPSVRIGSAASAPSGAKEADPAAAASQLARALANEGKLAEALEWCERAIAADRLNPAGHYLHAGILQELGKGERAVEALKRALYLEPGFALAHFALANLRLSLGRRREAMKDFENAAVLLRARPRDEPVPESEGLTAGGLGDIVDSLLSGLPGPRAPRV